MPRSERKLSRAGKGALLGGVCAGIGRNLEIDPVLVRIAMVVMTIATGGLGIVLYGLLWVILPADRPEDIQARPPPRDSRNSWLIGSAVGLITFGLLFVFRELGIWWSDALVWPVVLAAAGAGLLWRQFSGGSDETSSANDPIPPGQASGTGSEKSPTGTKSRPGSRLGSYRGLFGLALVLGAAVLFLYINGAFSAARDAALAGVTVIVVAGLVLAPLWVRLGRNLGRERAERIRSQERAEVAAHLHDSVLQTLALMQKQSDDPRQVSTLARRQERELREWLSGKTESERETSLASALEAAAAEVEERHGVPIDVVTVGDHLLDERGSSLVAASREAMTNAARYAGGAGEIRLYAEITEKEAQVFVRDRGPGFDLDSVPEDRRGVRDSIFGRMKRLGGKAELRSGDGEGTEVELTLEMK